MEKKKRREEKEQILPGIELGTFRTPGRFVVTTPRETHSEIFDNILLKAFSLEHEFRDNFQENDCCFDGGYLRKRTLKCFLGKKQFTIYNRIYRTVAQLSRCSINQYKLTCEQNARATRL